MLGIAPLDGQTFGVGSAVGVWAAKLGPIFVRAERDASGGGQPEDERERFHAMAGRYLRGEDEANLCLARSASSSQLKQVDRSFSARHSAALRLKIGKSKTQLVGGA